MNDRYLYRAKRIDNGEWVEGFLFQLCYDSIFCWCIGNEPLSPNDYSELCGFNREWFYIDESTICQCTGLKDKNGKKIFEGDILRHAICYEIKSCREDIYSGNGLNFLGEQNYIVTTMECYKDLIADRNSGKLLEHIRECNPESSRYYGIMVAIPESRKEWDEFENPTPLTKATMAGEWRLHKIIPCTPGPRKRSITELLFYMLRSGK